MTGFQKFRAWLLAGSVLALLAGGAAYVVWEFRQSAEKDEMVLFDPANPDLNKGDPYHRIYRARWERVPLAELPWRAIEAGSEPASVTLAAVPNIRPRRNWVEPDPATVTQAFAPWGRDIEQPLPAEVSLAHVPHKPLAAMVRARKQK